LAKQDGSEETRKGNLPTETANSAKAQTASAPTPGGGSSLVDELKAEHRKIRDLLDSSNQVDSRSRGRDIASLWLPHTAVEAGVLVPALQGADLPSLAEAAVRRDIIRILLADLTESGAAGPEATFSVLAEELKALLQLEEDPQTGLPAQLAAQKIDLEALVPAAARARQEAQSRSEGGRFEGLEPTFLRPIGSLPKQEYRQMPYSSNDRDRDDRGRFRSDDDDRRSYRGNERDRDDNGRFMSDDDRGYRSRSSRDDDDNRGYRGNDRDRDENGRFVSDDDRGYRSRSSRYEDDDDRRSSRGDGRGWHSDSRGHSEAAREGWEHRDDGGRYASSRSDGDNRGYRSNDRDRDENGRFVSDDRGYSSRSSRYDDDDRRSSRGEGRGWHGDPEGHSEASREGWEHRGEGRSSSSHRYEDDDRGSRGEGRGHGGWFGDSRGHSEASRRGWEDRR